MSSYETGPAVNMLIFLMISRKLYNAQMWLAISSLPQLVSLTLSNVCCCFGSSETTSKLQISYDLAELTGSSAFGTQCFTFNESSTDCNTYGRAPISWTITEGVPCPFAPQMCIEDSTVRFETEFIDSNVSRSPSTLKLLQILSLRPQIPPKYLHLTVVIRTILASTLRWIAA